MEDHDQRRSRAIPFTSSFPEEVRKDDSDHEHYIHEAILEKMETVCACSSSSQGLLAKGVDTKTSEEAGPEQEQRDTKDGPEVAQQQHG